MQLMEETSRNKEHMTTFRFEDVFKKGDVLSHWVLMLSAARTDLNVAFGPFIQALGDDGKRSEVDRAYFLRLCASHFREAVKLLDWGEKQPEIEKFISELSKPVRDKFEKLRALYTPFPESFVRNSILPIRDNFFHYCMDRGKLKQTEIDAVLDELDGKEAAIYFGSGMKGEMRMRYASDVLLNISFKERSTDDLKKIIEKISDGIFGLTAFVDAVAIKFFEERFKKR